MFKKKIREIREKRKQSAMTREEMIAAGFKAGRKVVRQEFLDLLKQIDEYDKSADMTDGFFVSSFVQGAEWALKQSQWVSVNDGLPDIGQEVVVHYPVAKEWGNTLGFETRHEHGTLRRNGTDVNGWDKNGFQTIYNWDDPDYARPICVDYWLPLPPIPKGLNQ